VRISHRLALHALWIATALRILVPSAADPDLWGHLLFGDVFLHAGIAATNGFAYTTPAHPWIDHELGAEAVMAAVYAALGSRGLVLLKVMLVLATLALVRRAALRRCHATWAATIATAFSAVIMAPGFMIRPQLFTLLGVALVFELVGRAHYRPRGIVWMLPLVVAVWINLHGGALAGIGLAAIGLASGAWHGPARRRELEPPAGLDARSPVIAGPAPRPRQRADLARAAILILFLAAATLVNVYGARLPWFLVTKVTPRVPISEWAPVPVADLSFAAFKAALVAIVGWLVLAHRGRLAETLVVLAAAAAALLHQRHIPLFAIAAAPLLAAALRDVGALLRLRRRQRSCARLLRGGIAALTAVQVALAIVVIARSQGRIDVDPGIYPVQALRFLTQNDIVGRVALPFDWGEVALWSLPAGSSVAVDGRFTTAYPQYLLDESWRFMRGGDGWSDLLTRYPTDVVVSARSQPPSQLLRDDPEWTYVYSDPVAVVFLRRVPSQAAAIARFHDGRFTYDATPLDPAFQALARGTDDGRRASAGGGATPGAPDSATLASAWRGP